MNRILLGTSERGIGLLARWCAVVALLVGSLALVTGASADSPPVVRPDSRLVYASASSGNDANDGLTPATPKRTLAAAAELMRQGFPDWLLLRRGDQWNEGLAGFSFSGRSVSEPAVVTAYGPGGAAPRVMPSDPTRARPDGPDVVTYGVDFPGVSGGDAPVLVPGSGWTGPTSQPGAVGNPGAPGYDAKAIARWDVVPFQTFDGVFEIGVVAFHVNGIDRVDFAVDGGSWVSVYEMTLNPRTDVWEYWVNLDASLHSDGPVEVRAIAWPTVGEPRVLAGALYESGPYVTYPPTPQFIDGNHSMVLHANGFGSLVGPDVYVKPYAGVIEGDGSFNSPYTRITDAITAITRDPSNKFGRVILKDAGRYQYGPQPSAGNIHEHFIDSWVTVKAADGVDRDDIVIVNDTSVYFSPRQARIKYEGVSFDDTPVHGTRLQFRGTVAWFHNVRFFDSLGWEREAIGWPFIDPYYATDCVAEDKLYAFPGAAMIRGCHAEKISGDVWQMSKFVLKSTAENIDGAILNHHTDLYQMWSWMENLIVYGCTATNLNDTQSIFLQPSSGVAGELTNAAFVAFDVENESIQNGTHGNWGGAPFSQLQGIHKHVLFIDVSLPNQRFLMRTDAQGAGRYQPHNVLVKDSTLHWATYDSFIVDQSVPQGVTIENLARGPE